MTRWRAPFAAGFALAALLGAHGAARAQIYRCEAENGVPLFQNTPTGRNCRALDLSPLTSIPAPKLPAQATARPVGRSGAAEGPSGESAPGAQRSAGGMAGGTAPGASAGAAGFPRVEAATQRARDSDRRRIIEDELKREEAKLAELKRDFNGGEPERRGDERNYQKYLDRVEQMKADIARSEGNVGSLRRELGALRD